VNDHHDGSVLTAQPAVTRPSSLASGRSCPLSSAAVRGSTWRRSSVPRTLRSRLP